MFESVTSYNQFVSDIKKNHNTLILYAVPFDEDVHPCATNVSAVFIKDVETKETHCISFGHTDIPTIIDKITFVNDFNDLMWNRKWVFDKKSFIQMLPVKDLFDFNLHKHLWEGYTLDKTKYETPAHRFIYRSKAGQSHLNNAVPLLKHKEMFDALCHEIMETTALGANVDEGFRKENEIVIETLAELESNGICVDPQLFNGYFDAQIHSGNLVYSQYNIYTATGRPSNHFNNVNYAALNKDNGVRRCFVSRYGKDGKIAVIDYSAFHPRIISYLINFPIDINTDIYKYLGNMFFKRQITEYDMDEIKKITFRQLYGGVEEKYEHIKYFANLKEFINKNWSDFEKNKHVLTPMFKRQITDRHVADPNPSKLFNYILQATETEVAIPVVKAVNEYLKGKKTKAVLYTYDSLMLDFHKDDGVKVLDEIMKIMKMGERFPIKVEIGDSYDSINQIYP